MTRYRGYDLHYDLAAGLDPKWRSLFVELELDATTRGFIDWALDAPQPTSVSRLRDEAVRTMGFYDANATADAYHMQTLSTEQWGQLPGVARVREDDKRALLDVGAGDGRVTAQLAAYFDQVLATETSGPMLKRLRARGFEARSVDLSLEPILDRTFDFIAVQNVLDRTARPNSLLTALPPLLNSGGQVAILVPVPLRPTVFVSGGTRAPEEPLPSGSNFGTAANALTRHLETHGFEVLTLSRAPYLCRGDRSKPLIVLDDLVLLCRPSLTIPIIG